MCGELEAQSQNLQWSTHGRLIDVELRSSATYWDPNAACLRYKGACRYKGALPVQRSFAGTKELCRYKGALPVQRSFAGTKELAASSLCANRQYFTCHVHYSTAEHARDV